MWRSGRGGVRCTCWTSMTFLWIKIMNIKRSVLSKQNKPNMSNKKRTLIRLCWELLKKECSELFSTKTVKYLPRVTITLISCLNSSIRKTDWPHTEAKICLLTTLLLSLVIINRDHITENNFIQLRQEGLILTMLCRVLNLVEKEDLILVNCRSWGK